MFHKIIFVLSLLIFINGCASQIVAVKDFASGWVGRPMQDLKKIASHPGAYPSNLRVEERVYSLENGNMVYVIPIRDACFVHFEVDRKGIIIGYKTEGDRCY